MNKTNNTFIDIVVFWMLASVLLPVLHRNIDYIFNYWILWRPLTVLVVLLFAPRVFTSSIVTISLLLGFIFSFALQILIWDNANEWYQKSIFDNFTFLLLPVICYAYYSEGRTERWFILAKAAVIFTAITAIISIMASFLDNMIIRNRLIVEGAEEQGIAEYGFLQGIVLFIPFIVFLYKNRSHYRVSKPILLLSFLLILILTIRAQFFANILVMTLLIVFSLAGLKRYKRSLFLVSIMLFIIFLLPNSLWRTVFLYMRNFFAIGSENYYKITDFAYFVFDPVYDFSASAIGGRANRYPMLWEAFIAQPFFGDASYNSPYDFELRQGGHLYFMSRLTLWGILGFVVFVYLLFRIINTVYKNLDYDIRFYYVIAIFGVVLFGLTKNLIPKEIYLYLIFVIPGLYYGLKGRRSIKIFQKKGKFTYL